MAPMRDDDSDSVSNTQLWNEIRYVRRKVDSLEQKVLIMFGAFGAVSTAIAIFEFLQKSPHP